MMLSHYGSRKSFFPFGLGLVVKQELVQCAGIRSFAFGMLMV
jgi:hypothetical protein